MWVHSAWPSKDVKLESSTAERRLNVLSSSLFRSYYLLTPFPDRRPGLDYLRASQRFRLHSLGKTTDKADPKVKKEPVMWQWRGEWSRQRKQQAKAPGVWLGPLQTQTSSMSWGSHNYCWKSVIKFTSWGKRRDHLVLQDADCPSRGFGHYSTCAGKVLEDVEESWSDLHSEIWVSEWRTGCSGKDRKAGSVVWRLWQELVLQVKTIMMPPLKRKRGRKCNSMAHKRHINQFQFRYRFKQSLL